MRSFFRRAAFSWWATANRKKWAAEVYRQSQKFILKFQNKLRFLRSWRAAKLSILRKIGEVAFPLGNTLKDLLLRRWQEKKAMWFKPTTSITWGMWSTAELESMHFEWIRIWKKKPFKCTVRHPKDFSGSTDIEYFLFSTLQESNSGPWDVDNTSLGR